MPTSNPSRSPAGYLLLAQRYGLVCLPHFVESYISNGARHTYTFPHKREEEYPKSYWPGESDFDHLEFALKYEGLHFQLLKALLPRIPAEQVASYIAAKPTSLYARRIWFLWESFAESRLDLPDLTQGNYTDLLDDRNYYVGPATRSPRHRVNVNLPGDLTFCPLVRKTRPLALAEAKELEKRCRQVIASIPSELYARALRYLYTKETKSSYAIERETPDQKRAGKFAEALQEASQRDYLLRDALVGLQQSVVDPRFANKDGWRDTINEQNYVSRTVTYNEEEVHFIPPRPQDLAELMPAFLEASRRILHGNFHPVVAAAMIAYPFVFLHPFSDGNGRLHRFLIHYVLSFRKFAPEGVVFPVSATMLHRVQDYDASLESFSKPLLPLIDYTLDSNGRMTVQNDTRDLYRFIDCTSIAETLFSFIEDTIEKELPAEILYLRQYDAARHFMKQVVDLPNRHADLFVRLCLQNKGTISNAKRTLPEFELLTDDEVARLEQTVRDAFEIEAAS